MGEAKCCRGCTHPTHTCHLLRIEHYLGTEGSDTFCMFDFLFSRKQLARIVKVERVYDATRAREFVDLILSTTTL